jgi:hypothetical protein
MTELSPRADYTPVRRGGSGLSPVRRIMDLRSEALIDRARISAEITNVGHEAHERVDAAFDLAEHVAERSGRFSTIIRDMGNDPELHQMHSYIKGGAAAAIMDLMQGPQDGASS